MLYACGLRAISNGMDTPTLFPWRPVLVRGRTPIAVSGSVYEADLNLQCGASRRMARNAVCRRSLPCVSRVDAGSTRQHSGRSADRDRPLKPGLQKRLKKRTDCGGKHLGCSCEAKQGLQCGLSGNRVVRPATAHLGTERGTASIGNERCSVGKTDPHLSRKIYLFCCR